MKVLLGFLCLVSFSITTWAQESAPIVGADYQQRVNEAWQEASNGFSPANSCAAVKGSVAGRLESGRYDREDVLETAGRALAACDYDLPVRYFKTYLDGVAEGKHTCMNFMTHFKTQLPALTVQVSSQLEKSTEEKAKLESKIKSALEDQIREKCPDIAPWILR